MSLHASRAGCVRHPKKPFSCEVHWSTIDSRAASSSSFPLCRGWLVLVPSLMTYLLLPSLAWDRADGQVAWGKSIWVQWHRLYPWICLVEDEISAVVSRIQVFYCWLMVVSVRCTDLQTYKVCVFHPSNTWFWHSLPTLQESSSTWRTPFTTGALPYLKDSLLITTRA